MEKKLLEEIGLTKGEIAVYFALLETGSSTVGPVVDKAKVSSSKIYNILDRLIGKGLVSYVIKENRKYFEAASPKRILDYLKEKEESVRNQAKEVEKIMPELLLKEKMAEKRQEVNIYEGVKGVKTAREKSLQVLKKGEELMVMGVSNLSNDKLRDYWPQYHSRREKSGVKARMLFNHNTAQEDIDQRKTYKNCQVKWAPSNIDTPAYFEIFKDTTILGVLNENPIALEITNKDVAQSFKSYFEALWNQKVTVFEGPNNVTKFFTNILSELKRGEEYYVLNGNLGFEEVPEIRKFFPDFHKKRADKGIKFNALFNHDMKNWAFALKLKVACTKFLPPSFNSPLQVTMCKDKLYLSLWSRKSIGVLIENKDMVDAFKGYFDQLWNQDVTVVKGMAAAEEAWNTMLDEMKLGEEYYVIGASWKGQMKADNFFIDFHTRRKEKGVKAKLLFISGVEEKVKALGDTYTKLAEVRYLPQSVYSGMQINVYHKKVMLFVWRKQGPIVFTIEDETVHKTFKTYFETLWSSSEIVVPRE